MTADQIIAEAEKLALAEWTSSYGRTPFPRLAARHAADLSKQRIIQWLRDDAAMTTIEARQILGDIRKLTPADTDDWAKLILMKHGIADALEQQP